MPPVVLGELVVGLVFAVGVEVEDALDEVLAEHLRVLLQQQVEEAVLTQTATASRRLCVCIFPCSHIIHLLIVSLTCDLPGDGRNRVHQRHHEAEEEGSLPFHKFLLNELRQSTVTVKITVLQEGIPEA